MEIITGGDGVRVYAWRDLIDVHPGEVAIIDIQGNLVCICKNNKNLIDLSLFTHDLQGGGETWRG